MEDVSVSMKREAEKVESPNNELRETVTILMSWGLVLVNFEAAEDRFGDAVVGKVNGATGWDIKGEKQKKEVERRVKAEEHGRTFDTLTEVTRR